MHADELRNTINKMPQINTKKRSRACRTRLTKENYDSVFPLQLTEKKLKECIGNCGACLLDISEQDEEPLAINTTEKGTTAIGLINTCQHSFHSTCIQIWAKNATSCPQCKAEFKCIALYSLNGKRQTFRECTPVFFADTIAEDEDEESSSPIIRQPRRSRRNHRNRDDLSSTDIESNSRSSTRPRRDTDRAQQHVVHVFNSQNEPDLDNPHESKIIQQLRQQMRQSIEMERRRKMCERISADKAKQFIEQSLERLPYHTAQMLYPVNSNASTSQSSSEDPGSNYPLNTENIGIKQPKNIPIVPTRPFMVIPTRIQQQTQSPVISSFGNFCLKPPKYDKDFLLK